VCSGCRNLLMYPVGATSVCCAVCSAVTAVPPPGMMQKFLPECSICDHYHNFLITEHGSVKFEALMYSQAQKWLS
jgi:LSD1 subclass zinc finger protein